MPCRSRKNLFTRRTTLTFMAASILTALPIAALDNGLALAPPMGWNTFNCWTGDYDAQMIKDTASSIARSGLKDMGYEYVNIDGGWDLGNRNWMPTEDKFPNGIQPVADHVHSEGLKLGIYIDSGQGQEVELAKRFASWGVDFLKHDDYVTPLSHPTWTKMRDALLAVGRPILYSIHASENNVEWPGDIANMWRTSGDISIEWSNWTRCLSTIADGGGRPGGWPDPDMLEVGNYTEDGRMGGYEEQKAHFSLWCVGSAPLILGNDVRAMYKETLFILGNTEAIAVNQDTTHNDQKRLLTRGNGNEIWAKTIEGDVTAVVLFNKSQNDTGMAVTWEELGMPSGLAHVRDVWEHEDLGAFTNRYEAKVLARGCVFVKLLSGDEPVPAPEATWKPKPEKEYTIAPLDRSGWTITSSGETGYNEQSGDPNRLIDNDIHSVYSLEGASHGGTWVAVDMQSPQTFNAIVCDGEEKGPHIRPYESFSMVHRWEVYVSDDGTNWGDPVGTGKWGPYASTALMRFPEQTARYVKVLYTRTRETSRDSGGWGKGVYELYAVNVEDVE